MKKIEAVIRPTVFEKLMDALDQVGLRGLTAYDVMGRGLQKGQTQYFRGQPRFKDLIAKMKVEIVCSDEKVEEILAAIVNVCQTGKVGDGKIFVYPVEKVIRISSEETDESAL